MDVDFFSRRIKAFQERITSLYNEIESPKQEPKAYIKESFFELLKALEELQTAEEELNVQAIELEQARNFAELEHENYLSLLQFSPDGYLITDTNGTIREANPAACKMFRKNQQYLVGKPLVNWIDEPDRKDFRKRINRLRKEGTVEKFEMETRFHEQNASAVFSFTAGPVRNAHGKVTAVRWMVRDVSHFKEAQHTLEEYRSRFQTIYQYSPIGIQLLDQDGFTLDANPAAQRLLGYDQEDLRNLSFVDYVQHEDLEKLVTLYRQLARREIDRFRVEVKILSKTRGALWTRLSVARYQSANDPTGFAIASIENLTEQKETSQKLTELREGTFKKTLALRQSLARDLRTGTLEDLSLILHRLENIRQPDPEQMGEIEEIRMALQYVISTLAEKVNDLASNAPVPFDLKEAITALMDQVKWENPPLSCTIEYDDSLTSVPDHIRIELFNIFSAVVQNRLHQAHPSWFEIHAQRHQGMVVLEIQDDGQGEQLPLQAEALIREGQFEYAQAVEQAEALHGHISADGELNSRSTIRIVAPLRNQPFKDQKRPYEESSQSGNGAMRNGHVNNKRSNNKMPEETAFDLPEYHPPLDIPGKK